MRNEATYQTPACRWYLAELSVVVAMMMMMMMMMKRMAVAEEPFETEKDFPPIDQPFIGGYYL